MTERLNIGDNTIAYDMTGEGPLVVLANGIGDSRHSYRFIAPTLAAAGYRVANVTSAAVAIQPRLGRLQPHRHRRRPGRPRSPPRTARP